MKNTPKFKMIKVPAGLLTVHPRVQRQLVPSRLKYLFDNLDLDKVGVFHAIESVVDGEKKLLVFDGQHRHITLMKHGFGDWPVAVMVHLDVDDDARSAELFLGMNHHATVSSFDTFQQEVIAGKPEAVGALAIVGSHGLKVARTHGEASVLCVSVLKRLYAVDNGDVLSKTLETAIGAWGRSPAGLEGKVLDGIGLIFSTYNGAVDQQAMVKKLAKYPGGAAALLGNAMGLRVHRKATLTRCVAETVIEAYNAGRRKDRLEVL